MKILNSSCSFKYQNHIPCNHSLLHNFPLMFWWRFNFSNQCIFSNHFYLSISLTAVISWLDSLLILFPKKEKKILSLSKHIFLYRLFFHSTSYIHVCILRSIFGTLLFTKRERESGSLLRFTWKQVPQHAIDESQDRS